MSQIKLKKPTSLDVAKLAGVSQATVSRVYNKKWIGKISEDTKLKVLRAAAEIGYNKNELARGLNLKKTGIVGVIRADVSSTFYDRITNCIIAQLQKHDIKVMIFNAEISSDINDIMVCASGYQVDGLILISTSFTYKMSTHWIDWNIPTVLVNSYEEVTNCHRVYSDNFTGTSQMAHFLYQNGFRKFGYVSSAKSVYQNHEDRQAGFIETLQRYPDICRIEVFDGDYTYSSGLKAVDYFLNLKQQPEVIFCANELMALGVMDAIRYHYRMRVPEDISVAGFQDSSSAAQLSYELTALDQNPEALAEATVSTLAYVLKSEDSASRVISIPQQLIIRKSVKIPYTCS